MDLSVQIHTQTHVLSLKFNKILRVFRAPERTCDFYHQHINRPLQGSSPCHAVCRSQEREDSERSFICTRAQEMLHNTSAHMEEERICTPHTQIRQNSTFSHNLLRALR